MNGEFDFKSIESERQLSNFFGGEALIIYEPAMAVYQITVRNDDLINDFYASIISLKMIRNIAPITDRDNMIQSITFSFFIGI